MDARDPLLVVEDNEDDLYFMQRALRLAGNTRPVRIVGDGQTALDYLQGRGAFADRRAHPPPVALVLDLKLPYQHGLDVLASIRADARLRHLPVYVLTSSSEETDRTRAEALGVQRYLVKPPTPDMLRTLLAELKR